MPSRFMKSTLHANPFICLFVWLVATFSAALNQQASCEEAEVFSPVDNFSLFDPTKKDPEGNPEVYSRSGDAPHWNVGQWSSVPDDLLSSFSKEGSMSVSSSSDRLVKLERTNEISTLLAQKGIDEACYDKQANPNEHDLFIGPNVPSIKPPERSGMNFVSESPVTVGKLKSLNFKADVDIKSSFESSLRCEMNESGVLVGLVLSDRVSTPNQTIFYQITLYKSCGEGSEFRQRQCRNQTSSIEYYWGHNPFGVDDQLIALKEPYATVERTNHIAIDFVPRLMNAILNGPDDLDKSPDNWKLSAFYVGQHVWGNANLSTKWSNISLVFSR